MPRYYEFEVSLQELQPRIWRRFLLRSTATFAHLHQAIQESFGWLDCHIWEFRLPSSRGQTIAGLVYDEDSDRPTPDAKKVKLNSCFTGKAVTEWCEYLYDFGDYWARDVKLIAVHSHKEAFKQRLLGGERAAPPEDCGGTPGYERMVHFIETGKDTYGDDPDHLAEWLDGWSPDAFELAATKIEFDR